MRAAQRASSAYGNRPQPICRSQSQPFRRSQSQLPAASTRLFVPTRRWIPLALHRVAPYEYLRSRQVSLYTQETCVRGPRSTCVRCFWSKCRVKPCRPGARDPVSNFSGRSCAHKFSLEQKFRVGNRKRQGISEADRHSMFGLQRSDNPIQKSSLQGLSRARSKHRRRIGASEMRTRSRIP